ncbi:costars-domain-containing protein [Chytriomyces cf. hyalinus JEL632]|nr:costars-domain-containing protein [Chytriomyces cf. hyalinus JEL632]
MESAPENVHPPPTPSPFSHSDAASTHNNTTKRNVEEEVERLKIEIKRLGTLDPKDGKIKVPFGVIVKDDACANIFEALVGTLKAAKKRKVVFYESELLLQGVHDKVDIVLLIE